MLSKEVSDRILSIGCSYNPPRGGVAQVMYTYSREVYPVFHCITNSSSGSKFKKKADATCALIKMCYVLLINPKLKIVHIHTASFNSFKRSSWFVRLAKVMGRKIVLHIHGGGFKEYYQTNPVWIKKILQQSDAVITLSNTWSDYFKSTIGLDKVRVLFNVASTPKTVDVSKDTTHFHLLFLGQIYQGKGIFDLVEMLKEYYVEYENKLILDIGGGAFETESLLQYIEENHLEKIVKFHGWVMGDAKIKLFNTADAFILPSYTEGLPASIIEALTYGLPVLSTPVGGIPEIVKDNVNGLLFQPGDKLKMKESIDILINNKDLAKKFGEESYRMSLDYLPDQISSELANIYNSLL